MPRSTRSETAGLVLLDPPSEWNEITADRARLLRVRYPPFAHRRCSGAFRDCPGLSHPARRRRSCRSAKCRAYPSGRRRRARWNGSSGKFESCLPRCIPRRQALWCQPKCFHGMANHLQAIPEAAAVVAGITSLPEVPLVVISSGDRTPRNSRETPGARRRCHPQGRHATAGIGHWIQFDEPELVVTTIRDVVRSYPGHEVITGRGGSSSFPAQSSPIMSGTQRTAADLGVPEQFNAATYFVDRHLAEGRGGKVAIECGDERDHHAALAERVNRCGSALREPRGASRGARDAPAARRSGASSTPSSARSRSARSRSPSTRCGRRPDYRHVLSDSGAQRRDRERGAAAARSRRSTPSERSRARATLSSPAPGWHVRSLARGSAALERPSRPATTRRRSGCIPRAAPARRKAASTCSTTWSSARSCSPGACRDHASATAASACAKLFFAYGLGNAGYFPLAVGATSILCAGAAGPLPSVYAAIERHRPTIFFVGPDRLRHAARHPGGLRPVVGAARASAGEALPPALYERFKQRFGVDILDGIGSTGSAPHVPPRTVLARSGPDRAA